MIFRFRECDRGLKACLHLPIVPHLEEKEVEEGVVGVGVAGELWSIERQGEGMGLRG